MHSNVAKCRFKLLPLVRNMAIQETPNDLDILALTILSILAAGGTTLVRKKSCSITIRRWTLLTRGEISLLGTFSPYNRGPARDQGRKEGSATSVFRRGTLNLLFSNFIVSVLWMHKITTSSSTSTPFLVVLIVVLFVYLCKIITDFSTTAHESENMNWWFILF